ncbi:unnamed protein product [Closterium sp. NIES-65]|nr:unnamed protein product [Closterium sp. NIES-65]
MALDAARLIQQVGMQQLMRRRQSPRRTSAPEQLPDPQPSTWAYSRPVVILDAFWNLAFVVVTAITLFISQARNERPPAPLSIWLLGYAVQCAVHVICVLLEHERRESRRVREQREQRRERRRGRGRGRRGRRARGERRDRERERGREMRGGGEANEGDENVNSGRGEAGEATGDAEGTRFDASRDQSGEWGGMGGRGDGRGNVEVTGSRSEREREEEFISILRRRDAGRVATLDEAASVLITGRALLLEREAREGEALEGLLGEERAGGEDGRGDGQARAGGRMRGEEGSTVDDEEMMVGAVDEGESDDSDQRVRQHHVLLRLVAQSCSRDLSFSLPLLLSLLLSLPFTYSSLAQRVDLARRVESANTMFSFAWWLVGFTWILSTIDDSFKDAPILSWATTAFLAFDVFFVVFCVAVACVVGMAVCCCLPCIIALIYAVADQASAEGATREQIEALPKFKFYRHRTAANNSSQASSICPFHSCSSSFRLSSSPPLSSSTTFSSSPATRTAPCPCCSSSAFAGAMWRNAVGLAAGLWRRAGRAGGNNSSIRNSPSGDGLDVRVTVEEETGGVMSLVGSAHPPRRRHVEAEDAECCVCLVRYEDGCVLRELPCSHHFHAACIDKWLKSHPTCPLCKRDITKGVGSMPSPDTLPSSLSAGASVGGALESTPGPSGTP